MNKNTETKMNLFPRLSRLFVALTLVVASTEGAFAQTLGATVASFNILANQQVTLTGPNPITPLVVNVVGTSPGVALTLTDASVNTSHLNDTVSINGQAEGLTLWNSLTAPAGATVIALAAATMPPNLPLIGALPAGVTIFTAAANLSNTGTATTITGVAGSIVIFQVATAMTMTDHDVTLVGVLPSNVYYQVVQAASITNDDALTRSFPGTVINNTGAQDIAIVCSGAGSLNIGRFVSLQGKVSVTQSGAGTLGFVFPAGGAAPFTPGCTDGLFYPSPATGATGTFAYCMETAGDVKIRVYNTIGDLAVKIDDSKSAGSQTSTVNTARLAPGVYFYILERNYVGGNKSRSKVKKFAVQH
ncbi:MAG: T9SS type A sorting domain-containing protein [Elusimicrobiota bacterium]